jgi:hypothetical protein
MNDFTPTVTLSRSELYMLLGEVALPPFVDHPESSAWDCAPLVAVIEAKVEKRLAGKWNEVSV